MTVDFLLQPQRFAKAKPHFRISSTGRSEPIRWLPFCLKLFTLDSTYSRNELLKINLVDPGQFSTMIFGIRVVLQASGGKLTLGQVDVRG